MNSFHAFAAVPICSVGEFESTQPNIKTRKPSAEDSHQSASENLSQKHAKKKPCGSRKTDGKVKLRENVQRKNPNEVHNDANYDFSLVPAPVCSCTGVARRCYKYGPGAWQSTCCTTSMSEYPLPMNPSRPGRRIAGRKMKRGAYTKLLIKFATEGHDLSYPVDLKNYWGKRGTDKFGTTK